MSPSGMGVALGFLNLVVVFTIIAIGIIGIVKTSGPARSLIAGGVGALVLGRLAGMLVSVGTSVWGLGGLGPFVFGRLLIELLTLTGVALLVVAAITAARSSVQRSPASAEVRYPTAEGWR